MLPERIDGACGCHVWASTVGVAGEGALQRSPQSRAGVAAESPAGTRRGPLLAAINRRTSA